MRKKLKGNMRQLSGRKVKWRRIKTNERRERCAVLVSQ